MKLPVNADETTFNENWHNTLPDKKLIRCTDKGERIDFYIEGGKGSYLKDTGTLSYETYQQNKFILLLNQLHGNRIKGWRVMADIFAITLCFLVISGLFLARGKNGFRSRGVWFFLSGIIVIIIFLLL